MTVKARCVWLSGKYFSHHHKTSVNSKAVAGGEKQGVDCASGLRYHTVIAIADNKQELCALKCLSLTLVPLKTELQGL
nr:uncharacterized protein LOC109172612 isoform X2 [Ipomoea batatas]